MMEYAFEWNDTKITVQAPNGFTRAKKWHLTRLTFQWDDEQLKAFGAEVAYHLANTVKVEGDIGFPVPNGNVTAESFRAFCEGLGTADETLLVLWDNALWQARQLRNDPDLLPPEEVDPKNE